MASSWFCAESNSVLGRFHMGEHLNVRSCPNCTPIRCSCTKASPYIIMIIILFGGACRETQLKIIPCMMTQIAKWSNWEPWFYMFLVPFGASSDPNIYRRVRGVTLNSLSLVVDGVWILQKLFLDNLRKALAGHGGSRQLTESAAVACVKLCKASTYISWEDNSVIFLLVQSMVVDLKVKKRTGMKPSRCVGLSPSAGNCC